MYIQRFWISSSFLQFPSFTPFLSDLTVEDDWSAAVIPNASLEDLDEFAVAKAREGYKQRFPRLAKECDKWSDSVFLDKAALTVGGNVTRTTLLLVGKETSAYKLNHIAQIVWKCFQDGQVFGDIYTIPFILTTSELLSRIRNYRFKIYPKNSLIPAMYGSMIRRVFSKVCIMPSLIKIMRKEPGLKNTLFLLMPWPCFASANL